MEVGKLILNVAKKKVTMTLSVKPFGCMPSSSVSDGVQSLITEMYPEGIFLPIETNGDGAVNVYSRVQMQLFKAKQLAKKEVERALAETGMTMDEVRAYLAKHPEMNSAFHRSPHVGGASTTDLVYEVASKRNRLSHFKKRITKVFTAAAEKRAANESLIAKAKAAAAKAKAKKAVTTAPEQTVETEGQVTVPAGKKQLRVLAN